jgi:glycosyltransferase involved in cell wall biosynthesis
MSTTSVDERIHVCIVTTAHPVDDVRVNNKIAHAFRSAGFRVTWVGPGYSFFDKDQYNRDGVQFVLTPPLKGRFDRLVSKFHVRRLAGKVENVDVYYSPDPDSAPISVNLARRHGAKSIFDVHEIYHGENLDKWLFGLEAKPIREMVRRGIARTCLSCDLVMGVSDAVLDPVFQDRTRRLVVRSCAPSWFAAGPPADVCGQGRRPFRFMHGKGWLQYNTATVLEALGIVRKKGPCPKLVVMASGEPAKDPTVQALIPLAEGHGILDAIEFRKGVPLQEMPDVLRSCDVGLISYGRGRGVDILPNRLFEYLAMGLPVIAPSYASEIARIIESEQCGLLVDFEDPAAIAEAIIKLQENPSICQEMGRRGRAGFIGRHNWEAEVEPLLNRIRTWFPDKVGSRG